MGILKILVTLNMMNWIARRTVGVRAFQVSSNPSQISRYTGVFRLKSTKNPDDIVNDNFGRKLRQRPNTYKDEDDWGTPPASRSGSGWDDNDDDWSAPSRNSKPQKNENSGGSDGWDDFDPFGDNNKNDRYGDKNNNYQPPKSRMRQPSSRSSGERPNRGGRDGYPDRPNRGGRGGGRNSFRQQGSSRFPQKEKEGKRSINMNALEGAGFVHLYGLSSVLNALKSNRRDFETSVEKAIDDSDETGLGEGNNEEPKPETQFRPYLFVQARESSTRKGQKTYAAEEVMALAEERGVPIAEVDKGVLNALSGNRPHQGFVLRCGQLDFEPISNIPLPDSSAGCPSIWLVLDEVVDPQNLGALLRSAYFMGGGKNIGVLVCSKNSAPPTPVVSAASAGALEVLDVYSTSNLPRTLNQAKEDGFRIIGASSSVPRGDGDFQPILYDLQDLPVTSDQPVLLVLGSEGHGLRTLVAKACSEFVRIPPGNGGSDEAPGVDSLNVSVTGGILLWNLLNSK